MPDLPQSMDFMDSNVQLREHVKINKTSGALYNTKQWCKVMFYAQGFEPKSQKKVKEVGEQHKCMWLCKDCKKIFNSINDGKMKRDFMQQVQSKLRMRSKNFITPKELVRMAPCMREALATTLLANAMARVI